MPVIMVSRSLLTNDELVSLVSDTLEYVENIPKEDRTLQSEIQGLKELVLSALGLSGKKVTSETTKLIQGLHDQRRKKRNELVACTKGFTFNPKDSLKNAAYSLMDAINKFPLKKTRVPYSVLTNRINSLIKELENHKEELETLGLTMLIDQLKELQASFEAAKARRVSENKVKLSSVEYKNVIDSIRERFPQLLTNLNSAERAFPDEYKEIVANVNLIIQDYIPSAKARNTRKNSKSDSANSGKSPTSSSDNKTKISSQTENTAVTSNTNTADEIEKK